MPRSPVCVDASLIVALVTAERFSRQALSLWAQFARDNWQPVAPTLLRHEVTSALHRQRIDSRMTTDDAKAALQKAMALNIRYQDPPDLPLHAFDLAARFNRPAAYDAHYMALAVILNCPLWTADERLFNAVRANFRHIRWLGDYSPEP